MVGDTTPVKTPAGAQGAGVTARTRGLAAPSIPPAPGPPGGAASVPAQAGGAPLASASESWEVGPWLDWSGCISLVCWPPVLKVRRCGRGPCVVRESFESSALGRWSATRGQWPDACWWAIGSPWQNHVFFPRPIYCPEGLWSLGGRSSSVWPRLSFGKSLFSQQRSRSSQRSSNRPPKTPRGHRSQSEVSPGTTPWRRPIDNCLFLGRFISVQVVFSLLKITKAKTIESI